MGATFKGKKFSPEGARVSPSCMCIILGKKNNNMNVGTA